MVATLKNWYRWLGRGVGTASLVVLLFIVTSEIVWLYKPMPPETPRRGWVLAGLVFTTIAGTLIAWRWKRTAGIAVIIAATALAILGYIAAEQSKLLAAVVLGSPFLLAGILLLMSWWGAKTR